MKWFSLAFLALFLGGCVSWWPQGQQKQSGSVVDYLYGNKAEHAAGLGLGFVLEKLSGRVAA